MNEPLAVISDIHGNLEALNAVLKDISRHGIQKIVCLGDIVGYGPYPRECLDIIKGRCAACVMGNHDHAVFHDPIGFNEAAMASIEWTRICMGAVEGVTDGLDERLQFLRDLPESLDYEGLLLVHGSPRSPTFEYILPWDVAHGPSEKILAVFDMIGGPCFIGHSHFPGIITKDWQFIRHEELPENTFPLSGEKVVVNVGSVGQPRDRNPKACYVWVRDGRVVYRRVGYCVRRTAKAILKMGLPAKNADRLRKGM